MSSRGYPRSVPAGGQIRIGAVGDYIKLLSSASDLLMFGSTDVDFWVPLRVGDSYRSTGQFSFVDVRNPTASEITFELFVGVGDLVSNELSGTVQVSGVVQTKTLKERINSGYKVGISLTAAGANFPYMYVRNPVGSLADVFVHEIAVSSMLAGAEQYVYVSLIDLAVDEAPVTSQSIKTVDRDLNGASVVAQSVLTGGWHTATIDGHLVGKGCVERPVEHSVKGFRMRPYIPQKLAPGQGMIAFSATAGSALLGSVEFEEVII